MSNESQDSDNIQWKSYLLQLQQNAPQPLPVFRKTDNNIKAKSNCKMPYGKEFHGEINRSEAENILAKMPDGAFIVRQSYNPPGSFTLAIRDLVHDGLITFYVELKASNYIAKMCKDAIYERCPYVAYKTSMAAAAAASRKPNATNEIEDKPQNHIKNGILDRLSIIQSEKAHNFKMYTFKGLQWCDYCANFLWGLVNQGVKCFDCGFQAHRKCSEFIPSDCIPQLKYIKNIFGTDLTTLVKAHACHGMIIPIVIEKCIAELERREAHIRVPGLYRMSPYSGSVQQLQIAFETDGSRIDLSTVRDTHAIAATVKLYLRMLPVPLITFSIHSTLLSGKAITEQAVIEAMLTLPPAHRHTLFFLVRHLKRIHQYRKMNKMSSRELGVVFAPTLMRLPDPDPVVALRNADYERRIVETLILSNNAHLTK